VADDGVSAGEGYPPVTETTNIELHDVAPTRAQMRREILAGLRRPQKTTSPKFLYDQRGSRLFDRICELDEYYPTRTELAIMESHVEDMARLLGPGCLLIEFGSGSSLKTRILLDHLSDPAGYVPIDISKEHLLCSATALAAAYPGLAVLPVCADYTSVFHLPDLDGARPVVYFPGSTIGNFTPAEAVEFLRSAAKLLEGGDLIIGVDLKKDVGRLEAAYNDSEGVTAAFNLNLLARINRELSGDFIIDAFEHRAHYDPVVGRIEMHLISRRDQFVTVGGRRFNFAAGETIHTENSYKYAMEEFRAVAANAGFKAVGGWTDDENLFSIHYLRAESAG